MVKDVKEVKNEIEDVEDKGMGLMLDGGGEGKENH